jgi:hypothetical protein
MTLPDELRLQFESRYDTKGHEVYWDGYCYLPRFNSTGVGEGMIFTKMFMVYCNTIKENTKR